jgi:lysophospholipase L1-like esterase
MNYEIRMLVRILLLLLFHAHTTSSKSIVAVLGSSVARGYGCSGNCSDAPSSNGDGGCYQTKLKMYQKSDKSIEKRKVLNSAINGDNTNRALVRLPGLLQWMSAEAAAPPPSSPATINSKFVLVGLSLANEGYNGVTYRSGLKEIIRLCKEAGVVPVIGLCYANGWKGASGYVLTKEVNLEIQTDWNVPSVNFLGGVDDGSGAWATGYWRDAGHPNDQGQIEMYYTIVPSLFDSLALGKPYPVPRKRNEGRTTFKTSSFVSEGLYFEVQPEDRMHSFSIVFEMKTGSRGGALMEIVSLLDDTNSNSKTIRVLSINSNDGKLNYDSINNVNGVRSTLLSSATAIDTNTLQMIALVHNYARGKTFLYLNGALVTGQVQEKISPFNFSMGYTMMMNIPSSNTEYRDLLIYRAGLNVNEIQYLFNNNNVVTGSLEIYSPLDLTDVRLNLAQSLSCLQNGSNWSCSIVKSGSGSTFPSSNPTSVPSPSIKSSIKTPSSGPNSSPTPSSGGFIPNTKTTTGPSPSINSPINLTTPSSGSNTPTTPSSEVGIPITNPTSAPSPSMKTSTIGNSKNNKGTNNDNNIDKMDSDRSSSNKDKGKSKDKNRENLGISIIIGIFCGGSLGLFGIFLFFVYGRRRHNSHSELVDSDTTSFEMQENPAFGVAKLGSTQTKEMRFNLNRVK